METRELAYFVTVAEELNFTRAAERLQIAQPALSRAIRRLERRLGVTLLERTSRNVALTPAGEVLLDEARRALEAVDAAVRRTRRAGRREPRLVVAMKPGGDAGLLPGILAAYADEPDAIPVDVVCGIGERVTMLRDGRADVALLHELNDLHGFDTADLLVEDQVVMVSRDHRLAGRPAVVLADLAGETLPRWYGAPPGAVTPDATELGHLMQNVALGRAVAVVPESKRATMRADLVAVPVLDAPPTTLLLAWPEGRRSPALAAFVRVAVAVAAERYPVSAARRVPPAERAARSSPV